MKARIHLILFCIGLFASTAKAQPPRIVVQGGGAPLVFSSINAALAAAQPNDKVYLSGGAFNAPSTLLIDKPLHLFGAGIGPDSTVATGITTITTGAGNVILTTAASGSTFTGIIFSPAGNFQYGSTAADDDPTDMVFERCMFTSPVGLGISATNPVGPSSSDFRECVFYSNFNGQAGVIATLEHCVLDLQLGTGAEVNGFSG